MGNNRKGKPHKHATGVSLDRLVYKITDVGKGQNVLQFLLDLLL